MRLIDKRTKIITTIGPSSEHYDKMSELFDAGMTTIRLNFSHGDHDEQMARVVLARRIMAERNLPISIMLDTKGPEVRVGKFENDKMPFHAKSDVTIYTKEKEYKTRLCGPSELTVSYDMSKDIKVGSLVLVDDGKLQIVVTKVEPGIVSGRTKNAHVVKTNKRVNLPGTKFTMDFLSPKDIDDVRLAATEKMDYIAASFVNTPQDVAQIRKILAEEKAEHIKIIAKIESQYAVDNFDAILEAADGIMVARGDLGLEIPYYEVPVAQKMMIRKSRAVGKPVIVATQMLDSMENNPQPTRAEVSDVYLAVELGADATMLSGESAAGKYPVEAVEVMTAIDMRAEKEFYNKVYYANYLETLPQTEVGSRADKAKQVALKTRDGDFAFAVVLSRTGKLLSEIAKMRPNTAIIGVSLNPQEYTAHGITSSVFMYYDHKAFLALKKDRALARDIVAHYGARPGEKYLVVENQTINEFTF